MTIGIVGAGHIGGALYQRAQALGWRIAFVVKRDGVYANLTDKIDERANYRAHCHEVDAAFLAIPTIDDGTIAYEYLKEIRALRIPVVTCEKGALANYFAELEPELPHIGYSATVGGGTRLLRYLRERVGSSVEQIHAVVNGTLNYIFDEVAHGRSLGEVVEETKKLGYAEPGAVDPLAVINKEALGDVPMKVSILFNSCHLAPHRMRARDVSHQPIDELQLKQLIKEAASRRYIVSITRDNGAEDVIGGFRYEIDGWTISAGFKHIRENPLFIRLIPSGVNNAILISEGQYGIDGTYLLTGQGAGAGPTTASMIKDGLALLDAK